MIVFPNAKLNLGLKVVGKRPDGYHDISTVMVPVDWCDVLELTPAKSETTLTVYGNGVDCPPEKNLVIKAYNALCEFTGGLPPVEFGLQKVIPDGAGMGGGSADAAFAIRGLNELFNLGLPDSLMADVAAKVGADCPFFIYNRSALCEGIGERINFLDVDGLSGKYCLIVKPQVISISTREAYAGVKVGENHSDISAIVQGPISRWREQLHNDFEESIFPKLPVLAEIKNELYSRGAIYSSMTGSGAAIYGIFSDEQTAKAAESHFPDCNKRIVRFS